MLCTLSEPGSGDPDDGQLLLQESAPSLLVLAIQTARVVYPDYSKGKDQANKVGFLGLIFPTFIGVWA